MGFCHSANFEQVPAQPALRPLCKEQPKEVLQQPKHAERRVFKAAGKQIGVRRLDTLACVL